MESHQTYHKPWLRNIGILLEDVEKQKKERRITDSRRKAIDERKLLKGKTNKMANTGGDMEKVKKEYKDKDKAVKKN